MAQQNVLALGHNSAHPQTFNFDNLPVRTVDKDGEIWFVAADVCAALEINNPTDAVKRLDDDEKNTLDIIEGNRGNPNVNIISESGLYALVMTSRKAEAKRFKRWVTHDVLPTIRKTGSYIQEQQPAIEDRSKKSDPDFDRAAALASQAAQAVFEAVLTDKKKWLDNARFSLTLQLVSSNGKRRPLLKPIPPDAYIASLPRFTEMIKNNIFTSKKELADLASACFQRLNQYMD